MEHCSSQFWFCWVLGMTSGKDRLFFQNAAEATGSLGLLTKLVLEASVSLQKKPVDTDLASREE